MSKTRPQSSRAARWEWRRPMFLCSLLAITAAACGPDDDGTNNATTTNAATGNAAAIDFDAPPATPEVTGEWASIFGTESIAATAWSGAEIVYVDNEANVAITQSPEDDAFTPGQYTKIVWTEPADGAFFYCMVDFGRETPEDAFSTENTADATDPASGGCGEFAWTELVANDTIEVAGTYDSNFGGMETFSSETFVSYATLDITTFNNASNALVAQYPAEDMFNPSKFTRIEWLEPAEDGSFYYCIVVNPGVDTAEAAWADETMPDPGDPDNGGCGGFSWTKLTVAQ